MLATRYIGRDLYDTLDGIPLRDGERVRVGGVARTVTLRRYPLWTGNLEVRAFVDGQALHTSGDEVVRC